MRGTMARKKPLMPMHASSSSSSPGREAGEKDKYYYRRADTYRANQV